MDENKLLLAGLEDKYDRFLQYNYLVSTDFMNLQQQSAVAGTIRRWNGGLGAGSGGAGSAGGASGAAADAPGKILFFGGFEDAERRQVVFVPDYMPVNSQSQLIEYFRQNPDECPLVVLEMSYSTGGKGVSGAKTLTHRDYLGSLLGEGIKREKLGDIIVKPDGAQVVVVRELADYLMAHYGKAGRVSLQVQVSPISVIDQNLSRKETVRFTVSSPRLDNILSGIFGVSRKDAQEAVSRGMVFVNEIEASKPDMQLKGGEKVVLRGKGKAIYEGVSGMSKKGKQYVTLQKYI